MSDLCLTCEKEVTGRGWSREWQLFCGTKCLLKNLLEEGLIHKEVVK